MAKFKVGDEVVIVKSSKPSYWYANRIGEKFTVLDDNSQFNSNPFHVKLESCRWADEGDLASTSEFEKESTSKWLKENRWYIRTGSVEKSSAVQAWLFENDIKWNCGDKVIRTGYGDAILSGEGGSFWVAGYCYEPDDIAFITDKKEITIEFQTVVKSVCLPEQPKPTEKQLKIQELEETIAKAQDQVQKLKEKM